MTARPTFEAMYQALLPHLAEHRPDILDRSKKGIGWDTLIKDLTDKWEFPPIVDWYDAPNTIRLLKG